jgi:hypothetical protein
MLSSKTSRLFISFAVLLFAAASAIAQKESLQIQKILAAKSVYFNNQTGSDPVGNAALTQLRKWGRFQIISNRKQADLILLLSSDPYKNGNVLLASGQTGTVDNGQVVKDPTPTFNKLTPTRYAYLTVIDPKTGDVLWTSEHVWGGLLTGFNSAGERLIKKLESDTKQ